MNTPKTSRHNEAEATAAACGIPEDRYRVFIEDVADAFFETDLSGNFLFFNDALCRIFGYPREDIQNRNYSLFMDETNARFAYESFNAIFRTGVGVTDITWEILRKNGEKRVLEISANRIADDDGQTVGFRGIGRDITEKYHFQQALEASEKRAQEQYRASRSAEQRYRAFLKFLPDPVFVFNLDSTVSYLNPAFERVFGWTFKELEGRHIPFVPEELKAETRRGIERLFEEKVIHGFETQRYTKDGRLLDIVIDGAIFYDAEGHPAGQVVTLRDVTQEKRVARINQALFKIASALYRFRGLDQRLQFIAREIQNLLAVEGASVILLDEAQMEFFFHVTAFDDSETGKKMKEIRFPVNVGVAGEVYRTGKPLMVNDTSQSPYFFQRVDRQAGYNTRSMLDVPLRIEDHLIGVLCAVNKKAGAFDRTDVDLLETIASIVALPIENARINDELKRSYEDVKSLNRAKDRVIHHLSHELKTPVSVLSASLNLLRKKIQGHPEAAGVERVFTRAHRNLDRILAMQYEIDDILQERDYQSYYLLSALLDGCSDELEALSAELCGHDEITTALRDRIETLFGPREVLCERLRLDRFVAAHVEKLRPRFAHRTCSVTVAVEQTPPVWIPAEVLGKIVEGLVRNAVENTPDGGRIEVSVATAPEGPFLRVRDYGVGITEENQRLIFENYFTAYETIQYSSREPYDFNAGGKGFDLLRMKIFSERYDFKLEMTSQRCRFIPEGEATGPGKIELCADCESPQTCFESGGTTMTVRFRAATDAQTATAADG